MAMTFFGRKWDSPALDDAVEVPVPFGELCYQCDEPIEAGDSGVITVVGEKVRNKIVGRIRPVHKECWLREGLGSVAHLEGQCVCHGGEAPDTRSDLTPRQDALRTLEWINRKRASVGQPPM